MYKKIFEIRNCEDADVKSIETKMEKITFPVGDKLDEELERVDYQKDHLHGINKLFRVA